MSSGKGGFLDRLGIRRKPSGAESNVVKPFIPALDAYMFDGLEDFYGRFLEHFSRSEVLDRTYAQGKEVDPDYFLRGLDLVMSHIRSWKSEDLASLDISERLYEVFESGEVDFRLDKNQVFIDRLMELLTFLQENNDSIMRITVPYGESFRLNAEYLSKIDELYISKLAMDRRLEIMEKSIEGFIENVVEIELKKRDMPEYRRIQFGEKIMSQFRSEAGDGIDTYLANLSRYVPLTHPLLVRESAELFNIYREYFLKVFRSNESKNIDKAKELWNLVRVARVVIDNKYVENFENLIKEDRELRNYAALITFYLSSSLYYCLVESVYSCMSDMLNTPSS